MTDHILPHYDEALKQADELTLKLGEEILSDLKTAGEALRQQDKNKANKVIANNASLQTDARAAQFHCACILSQFHPLARDLRLVISLTRCADKLEECAAETASLTRRVNKLIQSGEEYPRDLLLPLFEMAESELTDALRALEKRDIELAHDVRRRDKELDKKHHELVEQIISSPAAQTGKTATKVDLLFIVRSLERIGDNAKSLAAAVVFITEAEDVRHKKKSE